MSLPRLNRSLTSLYLNIIDRIFCFAKSGAAIGVAPDASAQSYEHFLRGHIVAHPYWRRGHLKLAQLSMDNKQIETAYASALAVLELTNDKGADAWPAKVVLSECYLKRGMFQKAKDSLDALLRINSSDIKAKESLAAAELGLENFNAAKKILESIPDAKRSAAGTEALSYIKRREAGTLYN